MHEPDPIPEHLLNPLFKMDTLRAMFERDCLGLEVGKVEPLKVLVDKVHTAYIRAGGSDTRESVRRRLKSVALRDNKCPQELRTLFSKAEGRGYYRYNGIDKNAARKRDILNALEQIGSAWMPWRDIVAVADCTDARAVSLMEGLEYAGRVERRNEITSENEPQEVYWRLCRKPPEPAAETPDFEALPPEPERPPGATHQVYGWTYAVLRTGPDRIGDRYPVKVGRTSRGLEERLQNQVFPHAPETLLQVWCETEAAAKQLESRLHRCLRYRGREMPAARGREWFRTNVRELEGLQRLVRGLKPGMLQNMLGLMEHLAEICPRSPYSQAAREKP